MLITLFGKFHLDTWLCVTLDVTEKEREKKRVKDWGIDTGSHLTKYIVSVWLPM